MDASPVAYSTIGDPEQYGSFSFSERTAQEHGIEKCNGNQPCLLTAGENKRTPLFSVQEIQEEIRGLWDIDTQL